jgi:hypothetical protein
MLKGNNNIENSSIRAFEEVVILQSISLGGSYSHFVPLSFPDMVNDAGWSSLAYIQTFFPYIDKMHYISHHFEG